MIDRVTIDRIVAAADIVEVVGDFVTLKKKGVNYTACCPFHSEKTPSFIVSPAKGLYKCFGCGKGGGAVSFVMEQEKLTYPEALKWLARKYGIEVREVEVTEAEIERNNDKESMLVLNSWVSDYFHKELLESADGRAIGLSYFVSRGFTQQTIETYQLGYCPDSKGRDGMTRAALEEGYQEKFLSATGLTIVREGERNKYYDRFCGRVMFPILSLTGRVIGFGGRTMSEDKKTAKYLNSPQSEIYDKSHTLYGIFQAKKAITRENKCILVEGYTDVMQMHQSGVENIVASSGTSLTESQVRMIKRFTKNVTVIYDGDWAGIKASLRGIDILLKEGLNVRVVPLPEGEDPDSFARGRSSSELKSYLEQSEEDFLRFKARILMSDVKDDPNRRAGVIRDVVHSIALIEDKIVREVYIQECSELMGVGYELLSRSVVEAIVAMPIGRKGAEQPQFQHQNQGQQHSIQQVEVPVVDNVAVNVNGGGSGVQCEALERELVGYLVKYGGESFEYELSADNVVEVPVASTIVNELRSDGIEMQNGVYNLIFQAYAMALEAGEEMTSDRLLSSSDVKVSSAVADILSWSENYSASYIWERYDMRPKSEQELLFKAVPKAVLLYKSKVVEQRIRDLQRRMSEGASDEIDEGLVDEIRNLNSVKVSIAERYKRLL